MRASLPCKRAMRGHLGPEQVFVFVDLGRFHWQSARTAMVFEPVISCSP